MKIIAVVGGGGAESHDVLETARELGAALALAGHLVACGGLGGVMSAVSEGARAAGGQVLGILPGTGREAANEYITIPIATGLGEARNAVLATCADAVVAVGGGHGTLSEIAHALKLGKPVFALVSQWGSIPGVRVVSSPADVLREL
ncbi:MAG: TIGR00725 family protein [Planctomycetota bacterium]|jgi:uncharacterized protein (TIGR00725 family)